MKVLMCHAEGVVCQEAFKFIGAGLFCLWVCFGRPTLAPAQTPVLYAQDHVLVKLKAAALPALKAKTQAGYLLALASSLGLAAGSRLEEPAVSRLLRQRSLGTTPAEQGTTASVDLSRFLYLYLPPGLTVEEMVTSLATNAAVEYVEPDAVGTGALVPNDPLFPQQWFHLNTANPGADIHSTLAWDITQGNPNTLVAVLDSGLANNLLELAGAVVPGYNFAYGTTDTTDDSGHGTAVACVLGAAGNNALLGAGLDWNCQLMPIKVLDSTNFGFYSWWSQGVDYAVALGAKVINLSAGGFTNGITLASSISNAVLHGTLFVTAAHNGGTNVISFPGSLPISITVGATDEHDRRLPFSDYGPQLDLVAPGTNIWTGGWTGSAESWWGTSFATAQVSGVCSLLAGLWPDMTQDQARALLCAGADDGVGDSTDTPGFDVYYGWGRLNAYNSLVLAQTRLDKPVVLPNGQTVLRWSSPPNASQRQPYRVATAPSCAGPWTLLTSTANFGYTQSRTYWTNTTPRVSPAFFRVQIFQP